MPERPAERTVGMSDRGWYRIENSATPGRAVVRIYDAIGGWFGATAGEFASALDAIEAEEIELQVNSPGGDVFEALAIMNSLRRHPARVIAQVDGMAASAASLIVAGGSDEVVMGLGSELMIHNPMAMTRGDADLHRDSAERLDRIADSIARIYRTKAGGEVADWRTAMAAETWYSAEEAVEAGLADRVDERVEPSAPVDNRFDMAVFNYAGRARAPEPAMPGRQTPAASAAGRSTTERSGIVPTFLDDVRQRLGVAADADEATVLAAMDEALAERTEETPPAAQLPPGVVTVEATTLAELRAAAQRGDEARTRQEGEDREALVSAAVRDGRISPARREAWLAQLAADAGAAETLASLEKGLIPVGREVGHAGDPEPGAFNQAEYDALARHLGVSKGA